MNNEIEIDINKPINNSAQEYYSQYKKMKQKLEGLNSAIEMMENKFKTIENKKIIVKEVVEKKKLAWYEKYHWCFSRNNFLIIAGKDSTSNELLVKNYLEKDDLLFHSTIQGSAHVIIKNGQKAEKEDLEDCALFAAIFSKAWNLGFSSVDVFFVEPNQVSKTAESGEYLSKGAFVIRGEKNFFKKIKMEAYLGIVDINKLDSNYFGKRVFIGSNELLKSKNINQILGIIPGKEKKGAIAKYILKNMPKENQKEISLDEIVQALPPGTMEIIKEKKKKN